MPRRKATPSKRPLDGGTEAQGVAKRPTHHPVSHRQRAESINLSCDFAGETNVLWLRIPLLQTLYTTLLTALGSVCNSVDCSCQQLRFNATLLVDNQVKLSVYEGARDLDGNSQLPLAELFPGTYEAWLQHIPTLVELELLTLHVEAARGQLQNTWAFNMSVGVAWHKYMATCSSRGLVPVSAAPRAIPVRSMHHVMVWLLKWTHDTQAECPDREVRCKFRYWNEVEVLYNRFVGDNTAACAKFENQTFDMPEIYARIDALHQLARNTSTCEASESTSTDLLPTLRSYQKAAVSWMVSREKSGLHQDHALSLGVTFCGVTAKNLKAYDPFCAAFHAVPRGGEVFHREREVLRPVVLDLSTVRGGILADEMGLGKTVEVIALMLSHRGSSKRPQLLTIHNRVEGGEAVSKDVMSCICGSQDDHPMGRVQCEFCGTWHHQLCTGYVPPDATSQPPSISNRSARNTSSCGLWDFDIPEFASDSPALAWSNRGFMCYQCQSHERPTFSNHTTLIVSPEPIHAQWEHELSRHVRTGALSVIRYPGVRMLRTRLKGAGPSAEWQILSSPGLLLSRYDVVLTTYEALAADLRHIPTVEGGARRSSTRCRRKPYAFVGSPLVSLHFWRVCMDEAQVGVENTRLQAALTVSRISAEYRWVVTGTPFSSKVRELFGYMRFLRISPYTSIQVAQHPSEQRLQLQQAEAERKEQEILDLSYFRESVERNFTQGAVDRVVDVLLWNGQHADGIVAGGGILWRTGKKHVLDQLCLPPQRNEVIWCHFAAVERHFYDQQEKRIVTMVQQRQRQQTESSKASDIITRDDGLWQDLLILRQLCCHPQVGGARHAWGGSGNSTGGTVMTMDVFLQELVNKATRECEEAQRQLIGAQNGLAALLVLENDTSGAALKYMAVMQLIRTNWTHFRADLLPRLHMLQNLEKCVQDMYDLGSSDKEVQGDASYGVNNGLVADPKRESLLPELPALESRVLSTGLDPDSNDIDDDIRMSIARECSQLGQNAGRIRRYYLTQADAAHTHALNLFQTAFKRIDNEQKQHSSGRYAEMLCTLGGWWNDALSIVEQSDQNNQSQLVARTQARLAGFGTRWGTTFCSQLVSTRSLRLLLVHELEAIAKRRRKVYGRLIALSDGTPTEADVELSGNCVKCREGGTGPVCVHCHLYKELDAYKQHFLGIDKSAAGKTIMSIVNDEDYENDVADSVTQFRGGGSSVSMFVEVFKEIAGCARNALRSQHDGRVLATEIQSSLQSETEFWVNLQREWVAAKKLFQAQHQRLAALDELTMACSQLRLRQPGELEARTKAERLYKLEPVEVPARAAELEAERTVAELELRDKMAQLRYLLQLQGEADTRQAQQVQPIGANSPPSSIHVPTICAICLQELPQRRAVLLCAHVFCHGCVFNLAGGNHRRKNVRCPTCRRVCSSDSVTTVFQESGAGSPDSCDSKSPAEGASDAHEGPPSPHGGGLGSKLDALCQRVDLLRQENPAVKCLMFSQWPQMLELAVQALPRLGVRCFMYAAKRQLPKLLSQFQSCPSACVLALPFKIGANGLNIVEATEVLLIEPLLSASIEAQAVNRVHRLGQTQRTRVHRFIVQGSVEERIYHIGHKEMQGDSEEIKDGEELPRLGVAPGRKEQEMLTMQDLQELLDGQGGQVATANQEISDPETAVKFWAELVVLDNKRFSRSAACEFLERRHAVELRVSTRGDLHTAHEEPKTRLYGKEMTLFVAAWLLELPYPVSHPVEHDSSLSYAIECQRGRVNEEIRVWKSLQDQEA